MKATTDRILTAIFCDDIRHEIGNKMSFMGCYESELFVLKTPIALSRLCVYATVLTPIARPFKSLTLRVVLDGQTELARLVIPAEELSAFPEVQDETATRKSISTALIFSPFFIEKPTSLRLMADTEEGEIVGPRLLIKVAAQEAGIGPLADQKPAKVAATRRKSATKKAVPVRKS